MLSLSKKQEIDMCKLTNYYGSIFDFGQERFIGKQIGSFSYTIYIDGEGTFGKMRNPYFYSMTTYQDVKNKLEHLK